MQVSLKIQAYVKNKKLTDWHVSKSAMYYLPGSPCLRFDFEHIEKVRDFYTKYWKSQDILDNFLWFVIELY